MDVFTYSQARQNCGRPQGTPLHTNHPGGLLCMTVWYNVCRTRFSEESAGQTFSDTNPTAEPTRAGRQECPPHPHSGLLQMTARAKV